MASLTILSTSTCMIIPLDGDDMIDDHDLIDDDHDMIDDDHDDGCTQIK